MRIGEKVHFSQVSKKQDRFLEHGLEEIFRTGILDPVGRKPTPYFQSQTDRTINHGLERPT